MSFFSNLILGLAGAELFDEAEHSHEDHVREREQRRRDSIFWQDAALRDSNSYEDENSDGYWS